MNYERMSNIMEMLGPGTEKCFAECTLERVPGRTFHYFRVLKDADQPF